MCQANRATGAGNRGDDRMKTVVRWAVVTVVVVHGPLHLLGAAKGLGWAQMSMMKEPIGAAMGATWLAAAALVVAAGVLLAIQARWWWVVGALALVLSQGVIFTSWSDALLGTIPNVILLLAVTYTCRSRGPRVTAPGT
jgi:hypothetical protein